MFDFNRKYVIVFYKCISFPKGNLLHFSCHFGRKSIVQFLLSQDGIDKNILFEGGEGIFRIHHNKKAVDIAQTRKFVKIVQLFEEVNHQREAELNKQIVQLNIQLQRKDAEIQSLQNDLGIKLSVLLRVILLAQARDQITQLNETIFDLKMNYDQGLYPLIHLDPTQEPTKDTIEECLALIFPDWETFFDGTLSMFRDKLENSHSKFEGLKEVELFTIYLYTLKTNGQYSIYNNLNTALTDQDRSIDNLKQWKHYIHHFLNGLRKLPSLSPSITLYRGLSIDITEINKERYQVGKKVTYYSFISASKEISTALQFIKDKGTLLIIKNCLSGRSISHISRYTKEDEVIFPPGATFTILNIQKKGKQIEIQLKQIPSIEKALRFPQESQ